MRPLAVRRAFLRGQAGARRLRPGLAGALLVVLALTACATGTPAASPSDAPGGGVVRPVACTSVARTRGSFASPEAGTQVTIDQIAQAVGYPVSDAQPDTPSATSFRGYESCQYGFTTPTLGASETIYLVVGSNPLDNRTANDEFVETESSRTPLSSRNCTSNGCAYHFTSLTGIGDVALKGGSGGSEVIAARRGQVYLEVGPGTLSEVKMENLATLILSQVH